MKHSIQVPNLTWEGARALLNSLVVPDGTTQVQFDFEHMEYVEPFGMLVTSRAIQMFRADHKEIKFSAVNHDSTDGCKYAAHVGFFKIFGLQYGKGVGEAQGNASYIPITSCPVRDLHECVEAHGGRVGDLLIDQARDLAKVLARRSEGALFDILAYSVREILRNIVEHSRALSYEYCAQYWPSKSRVEVAILDRGVGVKETLKAHPELRDRLNTEYDALNWSLLPGISGKTFRGVAIDPSNPFQNSGFGLFLTSRLCRSRGGFIIGSRDTALELLGDESRSFPFHFRGTAVRLILETNSLPASMDDELELIIKEGDSIAERIPEAIKGASSASRLLRGSFSSRSSLPSEARIPIWGTEPPEDIEIQL